MAKPGTDGGTVIYGYTSAYHQCRNYLDLCEHTDIGLCLGHIAIFFLIISSGVNIVTSVEVPTSLKMKTTVLKLQGSLTH